ncbi:MAG: hypothetical protein FWE85_02140, partial [Clostridiales bacterium]|nr:hypothetical protein [Clostridiales bacterium]
MNSRGYGGYNGKHTYNGRSAAGRGKGWVVPALAFLIVAVIVLAGFLLFGGGERALGDPEKCEACGETSCVCLLHYPYEEEWQAALALAKEEGLYYQALVELTALMALPETPPSALLAELDELREVYYRECVKSARQLISEGDFSAAHGLATGLEEFFPGDPQVENLLFSSSDLVRYTGVIEHIFFHPLIVYPERAWAKVTPSNNQNSLDTKEQELVTVYEFKKILENLYARGYILIDVNMIYTATFDEDGGVAGIKRNDLWLPRGKKPLIITVDDLSYNRSTATVNGQNLKLILDTDGELASYSLDMDGKEVISRDSEIVTILDSFVLAHPDFSFNNSKGCLAPT